MKKNFTLGLLFIGIAAFSQTSEQREVIRASMDQQLVKQSNAQVEAYMTAKKKRVEDYLALHPQQPLTFEKNGSLYMLNDIRPDGTPSFINTKDNGQITNTKANSLYTGGSLGVNITGVNMVAGVWDGGQVNATHEALTGQVTMQAGQPLSSPVGNAHQTAVTGMMVGKNINDKRGIAYDATSQNYDWTNDLTEMATFADAGFLISNHSYGGANDNTTPLWQFGAYNDEAVAWDALLKSKTYYLPFIAAGNEQMANGNMADNGFDIITGSSACKNAMTIGSINADNSMSDYSNWGPTDDGRIKPDLVTRGTQIDGPLYTSNTGYTIGDGTSYAAPAAAASALLLQQYYYSLKNSYMPAPMLKALLCHSATDAGNPGPDAKFGWGILNVEKAAQIIQQSVAPNGTGGSKMIWITANPNFDNVTNNPDFPREIAQSHTAATGSSRVSLCWADDEGSEQTAANGVDPTATRIVYQFDFLFRRTGTAFVDARPYNNLSITSPNTPATTKSDWFAGNNNNYLQANIAGNIEGNGLITYQRKQAGSPAAARPYALIITGLKVTALSNDTFDSVNPIIFFDSKSSTIKMISNTISKFEDYKIYSIDGKLVASGTNVNEILFNDQSNGVYVVKYLVNGKIISQKFIK